MLANQIATWLQTCHFYSFYESVPFGPNIWAILSLSSDSLIIIDIPVWIASVAFDLAKSIGKQVSIHFSLFIFLAMNFRLQALIVFTLIHGLFFLFLFTFPNHSFLFC